MLRRVFKVAVELPEHVDVMQMNQFIESAVQQSVLETPAGDPISETKIYTVRSEPVRQAVVRKKGK